MISGNYTSFTWALVYGCINIGILYTIDNVLVIGYSYAIKGE